MPRTPHADFMSSLWRNIDMPLRLLLGGGLLALALSGCATVSQGNVSQNDQVIANYERALAKARAANDRVGEGRALSIIPISD